MSEITVDRKLLDIFEEAFNLHYSFETCNDPTNSVEFQVSQFFLCHPYCKLTLKIFNIVCFRQI